jgi:tetratricopeptide (TPR) repeat protein
MRRILPLVLLSLATACGSSRRALRTADGYLEEGRWSAAIRSYERVLEKKPGEPRALVGVARAWIASGKPEKALVPARVAAEIKAPGSREVLGRALLANGRGADALVPLTTEYEADPGNAQLLLLVAEAHLARGDASSAVSSAESALEHGLGAPASAIAAWAHVRAGNCDRAQSLAGRAITAALTDASIQAEAAAVFRQCGDPDQAAAAASTARTLLVDGPGPWHEATARRSTGGDTEGALRRMSWLRTTFPSDGLFAKDLGGLWLSLDRPQEAAGELAAALKLPPFADGSEVQGIHFADRRADAMGPEKRTAMAIELWKTLANARRTLGDLPGVAQAMEQIAVEGRSTDPNDWIAAAQAWIEAGRPEAGVGAARKAVELRPDHPATQLTAAMVYARIGDSGRAIGHGRIAWNLDPKNLDTALMIGDLYLTRGENREARYVLEIALGHHPGDPRLRAALERAQGY